MPQIGSVKVLQNLLHVTALEYSLLFLVLFGVFNSFFVGVIVTVINYKYFEVITQIQVKLGYNELGYNERSVLTNKKFILVGLGHFCDRFSRL